MELVDEEAGPLQQIVGCLTVDSPNCVAINRGQVPYCYSLEHYQRDIQDLLTDVEFHAPPADSLVVWTADHGV